MPYLNAGLTALDEQTCYQLLESAPVGRVLVSVDAMPAAFPVNYRLNGDEIVFRTAPGTKLSAAVDRTVLGFEADEIDLTHHTGWSVLAVGLSRVVSEPSEVAALDQIGLDSWWIAPSARYVVLKIQRLTGRRIAGEPLVAGQAHG